MRIYFCSLYQCKTPIHVQDPGLQVSGGFITILKTNNLNFLSQRNQICLIWPLPPVVLRMLATQPRLLSSQFEEETAMVGFSDKCSKRKSLSLWVSPPSSRISPAVFTSQRNVPKPNYLLIFIFSILI